MITPSDSPSSPSDYAAVTPTGTGPAPAPYDIQAPQADLSAAVAGAGAVSGAGIVYGQGPRQSAAESVIQSPPGYGDFDITAGFSGGWPNDVSP